MIVFITAVLVMAALQSFCKLTLLPRRWTFLAAALLIPLPFLFEGRIAQTSMRTLNVTLSSAATLENWCALVVIQELFTLVIGFSLLEDVESDGSKQGRTPPLLHALRKRWKYLAFLPSFLLPAGIFYLQMYLFNRFPGISFRTLTWRLALSLPLAAILLSEVIRLLRRDFEDRILAVLHAEYFLVIPAVFLPVAANARLIPGTDRFPLDSLAVLGCLAAFVLTAALGFQLYNIYLRRKKHVDRYTNP